MASYSRNTYNAPSFAPFQSGCSICYPSKDYVNQSNQTGGKKKKKIKGGDNTLISSLPGKNLFKNHNYDVPMKTLIKDNYGRSYNTSAGGSKEDYSKIINMLNILKKEKKQGGSKKDTKKSTKAPTKKPTKSPMKKSVKATSMKKCTTMKNANKGEIMHKKGVKKMKGGQSELTVSSEEIMNGGKKGKGLKKKKGGLSSFLNSPIPAMSASPINSAQKATLTGVKDVNSFIEDLKKNYEKSVTAASNVKIGDQRLIEGGKKDSKKNSKKLKGGNGSDFATTFNSRGPSNAPDSYWNVDGEKFFRQFNKTGEYIPNSQLAKAATPKLLSGPQVNRVIGYNSFDTDFAPIEGGKKSKVRKVKTAKKSKTTKKATTTKKVKKVVRAKRVKKVRKSRK